MGRKAMFLAGGIGVAWMAVRRRRGLSALPLEGKTRHDA
jgi:hypothetical protein